MDTRPYRMDLPSSLRWFEIDHPSVIDRKAAHVRDEAPACIIERFGLDLADRGARKEVFDEIGATSTRALALTEGVVGSLSVDEAGTLADDLHALTCCERWVAEYFSARLLRSYQKDQPLRDVPVRFDPDDWEAFFIERGWRVGEIRYLGEESRRLHRPVPLSLLDKVMRVFTSCPLRDMGYALLQRGA